MKQRVALVQRDIAWQNIEANLTAVERMLDGVEADVIVLSEMFQTGFVTSPEGFEDDGCTLEWMRRVARSKDAAVVGSVIVREGAEFRNRMYFVTPDGEVEHYDKHHLFSVGGEHQRFTAGAERKVVAWRGVRYLLEVCYDLRFPVWSRQLGDYDAILYVALWPQARREVWRTLLMARAMENQAYVVGVNRMGHEPGLEYAGDSMAVDYRGRVVCDMGDKEAVAVVDIDTSAREAFVDKFNVSRDADMFEIKC